MIMGVAAVAGIGLLLYLRKSGDQSTIAGSGALVGAASSAANWAASSPIVINASTKPQTVPDRVAVSPAPPPPAPPAPTPAATAGWGPGYPATASAPAASGGGSLNQKTGVYTFADGSTYQNPVNYGTAEKPRWTLTGKEAAGIIG